MRKAALILALMVSQSAFAASQSPNEAAKAEARKYLVPCAHFTGVYTEICQQNQADFLDDFLRARAGQGAFMGQMAVYFGTTPATSTAARYWGIAPDRVQGCAWLYAQQSLHPAGALEQRLQTECGDLQPLEARQMKGRADKLVQEIRKAPTVAPVEFPLPSNANLITTVPED